MVSRLFSSLLDRRLRQVVLQSERQKGFTSENGCHNNIQLLGKAISAAKRVGGVISVLDISKAFDTVPHGAIVGCLQRKGVPGLVARYISSSYEGCQTVIKTNDGDLPIELKRGVKQGDPLAPLLFNLIIEPLLDKIQNDTFGVSVSGHNLAAMAFADDIVLLASDRETAAYQIASVDSYLGSRGMSLSIEKSSAFQYVPRGKSWYIKNPGIVVRNSVVPFNEPDDVFKYLGATVSPWRGLVEGKENKTIADVIKRVRILPIKPMQKIDLLRLYLLPRYFYGLVVRPPSIGVLRQLDSTIREGAKRILHLHESTTTAFFYTPRKQGGLGLNETEKAILIAALRNGVKAMSSTDAIVRNSIMEDRSQKQYASYAASLGTEWPTTLEKLDSIKRTIKSSYVVQWMAQPVQGQGSRDCAYEPVSNKWLSHHSLLSLSRVIDAIKLRTNTFPTRMALKRAYPDMSGMCRACNGSEETLGHIFGKCPTTKAERIKRHNDIVDLLRKKLSTSHRTLVEPVVTVKGERYKPDLVIANERMVCALDVTVRYENGDSLFKAAREKMDKYNHIVPKLKEIFKVSDGRVVPIVVGSRGALPSITIKELKQLGIAKRDWLTISLIALRSSIEMINKFMDE